MTTEARLSRLFEVDNARNLSRDEVVSTFVELPAFWRLLTPKNHVVLGSRGSGKTALLKMLSHTHLSEFAKKNDAAKELIQGRSFIGIYVPARIGWIYENNKDETANTPSDLNRFTWKLNFAVCFEFIVTAQSVLKSMELSTEDRLLLEFRLCQSLSSRWTIEHTCTSFSELTVALEEIAEQIKDQWIYIDIMGAAPAAMEAKGISFYKELFDPLRAAIKIAGDIFGIPDTTVWLLCIDEIEFLSESQHQLLNTYLREHSGNLFFKLSTMPYRHYTLETKVNVPLDVGHDFSYVYLGREIDDAAENEQRINEFCRKIFRRRLEASGLTGHKIGTLDQYFKESELLDGAQETSWAHNSKNWKRLLKYCNEATINRAEKLIKEPTKKRFRDQIGRKLHGALILRSTDDSEFGRVEYPIYSGASMLVRCSDGNPRNFISILNGVVSTRRSVKNPEIQFGFVNKKSQHNAIHRFSSTFLQRGLGHVQGRELYDFILELGDFMHFQLYSRKLSTDLVSSVKASLDPNLEYSHLIKKAVGLGYLYPAINPSNRDHLPEVEGEFHLAFALAPRFRLLPRKGKSRTISGVMKRRAAGVDEGLQQSLFDEDPE